MTKEITKKKTEDKVKENTLIISPRITEKASLQSNVNAFTFVVKKEATKILLSKEIETKYKVKPVSINMINIKGKKVFVRGKFGQTESFKKAVVFLKKGDTISLAN